MNMIDIDLSPYIVCCLLYEPLWTIDQRTAQSLKRQCRNQGENAPTLVIL